MTTNESDFLHFLKTRELGFDLVGKYEVPRLKGIKLKDLSSVKLIPFNFATKSENMKTREDEFVHFYLPDTYTTGTKVKFSEADTRYTVSETGERISKSIGKVLDFQRKNNPDGTATLTNIVQGSKGNLYAVDYTYRPGGGSNGYTSGIRRVKRKR